MTDAVHFETLIELYERSVSLFAGQPLFAHKASGQWRWLSYGEFRIQVDQARAGLAELGVGAGDRVAMISNNRAEWAIAAYATYGRSAAFVPMYEAQLEKEWEYILKDCEAKVVLVADESIYDRIDAMRKQLPALAHVVCLNRTADTKKLDWATLLSYGVKHPSEIVYPKPYDLAGLIYTSGTTGNPKGVILSHLNFASNVRSFHGLFPLGPKDCSLSFLPWAHAFGQTAELHMLFSVGCAMAIAESVDRIVPNLAEVKPTVLISVPRIFNRIYDGLHKKLNEGSFLKKKLFFAAMHNEERRKEVARRARSNGTLLLKHKIYDRLVFSTIRERFGGRLKFTVSGGAALSKEVAEFIDNLGITVYEGYGLTEAAPVVAVNWPGARKIGSVGKPLPGVHVEIDTTKAEAGNHGEIIVSGPNVMAGYYKLPEETKQVLRPDGSLRTGDMGYLDEDGFLYITGRIKEQYKLENGKYVVPSLLEERLKLSPYILNALVYGDNHPYNVALLVADMENLTGWAKEHKVPLPPVEQLGKEKRIAELYDEEVRTWLSECKLFERVRKVALIAEDFTTANGMLTPSLKVKRMAVLQKYGPMIEALYTEAKDSSA